jgi:putative flippase GtrA
VAFSILGAMGRTSRSAAAWRGLAPDRPAQLVSYVAATTPGALVNYLATLFALARLPAWPVQAAALLGIAAGAAFNFTASRYLAFKARHVRARGR